ncbi:MAG: antibiotic biosynthesis monooxygenase [Acidobacteria bacterium SCN 69-37]|nr:MAG: antibiotic biosynthesis monooxygenase [Acidobacteria bacterium SCN 69-37]
MILQLVRLRVKPDAIEAFTAATLDNTRHSRHEPGIVQFALVRQQDDPTRFVIIEAFKDEAAIAAHRQTPHYLRWRDTVPDMLAEPRDVVKADSVDPADADW